MVDLLIEEAARRATGDFIPPKPRDPLFDDDDGIVDLGDTLDDR